MTSNSRDICDKPNSSLQMHRTPQKQRMVGSKVPNEIEIQELLRKGSGKWEIFFYLCDIS